MTAGAARATADALAGLSVDPARMRGNLESSRGFVMAESVAMALAPHLGRSEAHHLVDNAVRTAARTGATLADALRSDPAVTRHLTPAEIDQRLDPAAYLGAARTFVERALARRESRP